MIIKLILAWIGFVIFFLVVWNALCKLNERNQL